MKFAIRTLKAESYCHKTMFKLKYLLKTKIQLKTEKIPVLLNVHAIMYLLVN